MLLKIPQSILADAVVNFLCQLDPVSNEKLCSRQTFGLSKIIVVVKATLYQEMLFGYWKLRSPVVYLLCRRVTKNQVGIVVVAVFA